MILIVGAGDVGSNIASDLTEGHDVTVIDRDSERINALASRFEITGVVGDGRSMSVLQEADINQADIVVASTDSDAANIMVCNAAKQADNPHTIARIKEVGLYRTWQSLDIGLGVDTMLCVDVLAAEALARTIALPGAQTVDTFADGLVEVAEFEISEDMPVANTSIAEADHYASATFAALLRNGDVLIPKGDTVIHPGDHIIIIGSRRNVSDFAEAVTPHSAISSNDNIVIAGGDVLGYQIAQQFEARGWTPRILERDPAQAAKLTTLLKGSSVTEADVTAIGGFNPDILTNADLVVGAVDDDTNYLLTQLASEHGVARTATVVDDPSLVELFEGTGLDVVVHPEDIIVGKVLQAIHGPQAEDISVFEHDDAEVIEVVVDEDSILSGKSIRDVATELPTAFVIGAIIRNGQLQIPRGNKIIQVADRVIAFVDADEASKVTQMI